MSGAAGGLWVLGFASDPSPTAASLFAADPIQRPSVRVVSVKMSEVAGRVTGDLGQPLSSQPATDLGINGQPFTRFQFYNCRQYVHYVDS